MKASTFCCAPLIKAKAPIDYDWLSRPFGGMFTQAAQPGKDGMIRYRTDGIRIRIPLKINGCGTLTIRLRARLLTFTSVRAGWCRLLMSRTSSSTS